MLKVCCQNQLKWRYALADSCFSSSENMKYIHATLEKQFIFALKSNRLIALSKEDKANGRYTRIDSIQWSEMKVFLLLLPYSFKRIFFQVITQINSTLSNRFRVKAC